MFASKNNTLFWEDGVTYKQTSSIFSDVVDYFGIKYFLLAGVVCTDYFTGLTIN